MICSAFVSYRVIARIGTLLMLALSIESTASAQILVTQNFDVNPNWTAINTTADNNNYGFSPTNFTGGPSPAGEAGGRFSRSGIRSYYGDTNLGGTFNRSTPFLASGEFDITAIGTSPAYDGGLQISHFNSIAADFAGVNIGESSSSSIRFRACLRFSDDSLLLGNNLIITNFPDSDRIWQYQWDPLGGASGLGSLSVTINGPGGGTSVADLTHAQDGKNFLLDAFGLVNDPFGAPDNTSTINLFIDGLAYTAVPEPGSMALCVVASAVVVFRRLCRRVSTSLRNVDALGRSG